MQRTTRFETRAFLLLLLSIPAFALLAACYQPTGNDLEATSIANIAETFTLVPSITPIPSDTPEPEPTQGASSFDLIAVTNTLDPFSQASTEIAMAQGDPLLQTATAMAILAQQLAPVNQVQDPLLQTATAMANFGIAPQLQEGIDPLMQTATAVIQRATETAGWPMTQTMAAILGPSPTFTLPFIPSATWTPMPSGVCTHTVVAGDNLFRISLANNTTVNAIAAANGIVNPALIIVGQVLTIPGCGGNSGQVVPPGGGGTPNCAGQTYIVQQGDSLFTISMQFNVTVNAIATCNNIANPNLIFINQQIVIPAA